MAEPLLDYWSDKQQIIVAFIQELTSVMFQLFCLSRLGTDEIFSNLILFLTLIIFAGPYLNTWITFIHHIFIKEDIKKYLPVAIFIMVMHGLGAFFASLLVVNISRDWADNIIWKPKTSIQSNTLHQYYRIRWYTKNNNHLFTGKLGSRVF
jgi:hypothetical protein